MLLIVATLLAGLGLFFVGLKLLTENLKLLSGRKLRENIAVWTKNPYFGLIWGGLFITITQSAAAATFILIGMLRAGMLGVRQALPILIGMNCFGGIIILLLIFDIKLVIFLLLGVTGLIYSRDRAGGMRAASGAAFGIGMLFLGLSTTQTGIAPLSEMPWFGEALEATQGSYLLGLMVGLVLSFITQSALAVMVLNLAFLQAGLFTLEQAVMITYGAKLGSSLLTYVLSAGLTGESRQVSTFQIQFNVVGAIILVPAFYLEMLFGMPLMLALAREVTPDAALQLALINLLFNLVPGIIVFPLVGPITRLLGRRFPQTAEEQLSRPKYLLEHTGDDPHNALRLIELEQTRLIEILGRGFDTMRSGGDQRQMKQLDEVFQTLGEAVRGAVSDLSHQHQLSPILYERLNGLLNIQHNLETANVEVQSLSRDLAALGGSGRGERFSRVAVDGIDAILLTFLDVARERSELDAGLLKQMTSEDGMTRVRKAYLAEDKDEELTSTTRMQLLAAANHCERLIWLFGEMGAAYSALESG
jgi:phosphate:Na+ symporter